MRAIALSILCLCTVFIAAYATHPKGTETANVAVYVLFFLALACIVWGL